MQCYCTTVDKKNRANYNDEEFATFTFVLKIGRKIWLDWFL